MLDISQIEPNINRRLSRIFSLSIENSGKAFIIKKLALTIAEVEAANIWH